MIRVGIKQEAGSGNLVVDIPHPATWNDLSACCTSTESRYS
jgi:hypothetical protein